VYVRACMRACMHACVLYSATVEGGSVRVCVCERERECTHAHARTLNSPKSYEEKKINTSLRAQTKFN